MKEESKLTTNIRTFNDLVLNIVSTDEYLTCSVSKAVNKSLTLRNWLIGFYIDVFELNGEDRANYGDNLFLDLSNELKEKGVSNSGKRQLYQYVKFIKHIPELCGHCRHNLKICRKIMILKNADAVHTVFQHIQP
jgi:hypothetical protein